MYGFVMILRIRKLPKRHVSVYLQNVNDAFYSVSEGMGCPAQPLTPGACISADAGKQRQISPIRPITVSYILLYWTLSVPASQNKSGHSIIDRPFSY